MPVEEVILGDAPKEVVLGNATPAAIDNYQEMVAGQQPQEQPFRPPIGRVFTELPKPTYQPQIEPAKVLPPAIEPIGREKELFPGSMQLESVIAGTQHGMGRLLKSISDIRDFVAFDPSKIGVPEKEYEKLRKEHPQWTRALSDELIQSGDYWTQRIRDEGADVVDELIGQTIGGFVPGAVEWTAGVPYAAVQAGAEAEKAGKPVLKAAIVGGAKRYILGKVLDVLGLVKSPILRRGAGGVVLGGAALAGGATLPEAAVQTAVGAAMTGKRERAVRPEEIRPAEEVKSTPTIAEKPPVSPVEPQKAVEPYKIPKKQYINEAVGFRPVMKVIGGEFDGQIIQDPKAAIHAQIEVPKNIEDSADSIESGFVDKQGNYFSTENMDLESTKLRRPAAEAHKQAVEQALAEGKVVPPEVLKDYPSFAKQVSAKPTAVPPAIPPVPPKPPAITEGAGEPAPFDSAVDKLVGAVQSAKKLRKSEVEDAINKLRAEQASGGTEILQEEMARGTPYAEAVRKSKYGYKGAAKVPELKMPDLSNAEWNSIYAKINELYPADNPRVQFDRTDTIDAFDKLRNKKIPAPAEFEKIEKVIGKKAALSLWESLSKNRPYGFWGFANDVNAAFKMLFGYDIQYFRQASTISQRNPVIFAKGAKTATMSVVSQKYADAMESELKADPIYNTAKKAGVNFMSDRPWAGWAEKGEQYPTDLPTRMARFGKTLPTPLKQITAPVRWQGSYFMAQNRSFAASMNQTMKELFKEQNNDLLKQKLTTKELVTRQENNAGAINVLLKVFRAKTPTGRAIQRAMNYVLFSPSMTISRPLAFKVMVANKGARVYTASAVVSDITKIYLVSLMAKLAGNYFVQRNPDKKPPVDSDLNATSTNWGKVISGRTYFDYSGGNIPFYRTLARLATLHYKNQAGQKKPIDFGSVWDSYLQSRESAVLQTEQEIRTGKFFGGQDVYETPESIETPAGKAAYITGRLAWRHFSPSEAQDVYDAGQYSGLWQTLAAAPAGLLSVGVQSYPESAAATFAKYRDQIAQQEFKKNWQDLGAREQKQLTRKYKTDLETFSRQTKVERGQTADYEYLGKLVEEEKKAGRQAEKLLSKPAQQNLKELGISIGLSRKIGTWTMNDARYEQYQKLTAEYLGERLNKQISRPNWDSIPAEKRAGIIKKQIETAKKQARNRVVRYANQMLPQPQQQPAEQGILERLGI